MAISVYKQIIPVYKRNDEQRKKMSEMAKKEGRIPPSRLGIKHTAETLKKMSDVKKGKKPKNLLMMQKNKIGKHRSEETKAKLRKYVGSLASGWKGGISHNPYTVDWNKSLRISIRERDKYICQVCGEKQGDRAFSIHHIDYNKLNSNPDNLITLCASCHSKTNYNRKYWIIYFNN